MRGAFIVLEGVDRSGKTTQVKMLADSLIRAGKSVTTMRFPDREEPFGRVIDSYLRKEIDIDSPQAMHLAFSANRWQKEAEIRSSIAKGTYVICDRYCYSGVAYSIAGGLSERWVKAADIGLPRPDLVLKFEIDPQVAAKRGGFGDERLECTELQKKVAVEMAKLEDERWKVVAANGSVEEVHDRVRSIVDGLVLSLEMDLIEVL